MTRVERNLIFLLLAVLSLSCTKNPVKLEVLDPSKIVSKVTSSPSIALNTPTTSPGNNPNPIFTISGIASGDAVQLFSDSSCATSASSSQSASSTSADVTASSLTDGNYTFYFSVNSICSSSSVGYTLDTAPPSMPSAMTLFDPASSPGSDTTPTFTVSSVTSGDTVKIYADPTCSTLRGSTVATSTSAQVTSSALTSDGSYTFRARVYDAAGNSSSCTTPATYSYTLDTTAPDTPTGLVILSPSVQPSSVASPLIQVSGVSSGDIVKIYSNSSCTTEVGQQTAAGPTVNISLTALSTEGTYYFYAKSFDSSLNSSGCSTASAQYYYVSSAVVAEFSNASTYQRLNEGTSSHSASVTLSAAKAYDVTLYYEINGNADSGTHHNLSDGSVLISSGTTSANINFNLPENAISSGERYFNVRLVATSSVAVSLGAKDQARVYVKDNEISYSTISKISAGPNAACGILANGNLKCWGANIFGQLGDASTINRSSPVVINTGTNYSEISPGSFFSCGITTSNQLKCWGDNGYGQLGDSTFTSHLTPQPTSDATSYLNVSARTTHACGITTSNQLKCWGDNGYGQLGDGTTISKNSPTLISSSYTKISVGNNYSCGINATGYLYCWGRNNIGQLGDGTLITRDNPTLINSGTTFSKVSTASATTCAITTSGILKCWGDNIYGQVGNGTYTTVTTPTIIDSGTSYIDVGVGFYHVCALTSSGIAKCWGYNGSGQVGVNDVPAVNTPSVVITQQTFSSITVGDSFNCALTSSGSPFCWGDNTVGQLSLGEPSIITTPSSGTNATDISTLSFGLYIAGVANCGITTNNGGTLYCFGSNTYGKLGDSTTIYRPGPTIVDKGVSYSKVAIGKGNPGDHTCAITTAGILKCWGYNAYGQLGLGDTMSKSLPFKVDGTTTYSEISNGLSHSCGVTTDGTLKCWGANFYAQVGDGTATTRTTPTTIDSGTNYALVSSGSYHNCAITTTGVLKCWGDNSFGQLGMASTATTQNTPVVVDAGVSYSSIQAGEQYTCGITSTGVLKCWGYNNIGQLGVGDLTLRNSPQVVDSGITYAKISTASSHTCGITTSGVLKCWGQNSSYQLGNGNASASYSPVIIASGTSFTNVFLGYAHTCGITSSNNFKCWGLNQQGQFGDGNNFYAPLQILGLDGS